MAGIRQLYYKWGLANAKYVLFYGNSSGGMAVPIWIDLLREVINSINPYTKVFGLADGGMFTEYPPFEN